MTRPRPRTIAELMAERTGSRPDREPSPTAAPETRRGPGHGMPAGTWTGTPAPTRVDPSDPESIRLV